MNESSKMPGNGKAARKAAERQRLAAALRENLKRRKAQARGRGAETDNAEPSRRLTIPPDLPPTSKATKP